MNSIIKADLYRYGKLQGFNGFLKGMLIPGFSFTYFLRLANKYKKLSIIGIISRFILYLLSLIYGYQIDARANIGKGFYIGHFGTVLIGQGATLGSNCNIAHNVTIGETPKGKINGLPIIGDKVWIGTGSVIVGKIQIGSNVLISPNTFVNFDIPGNSIVMGNPAKIIHMNNNPIEGYINNIID